MLHADYTKIKDYESVCYVKNEDETLRLNVITEIMALATMTCGIREITEKNADEFYARLTTSQLLQGYVNDNGSSRIGWVQFKDGEKFINRLVTIDEVKQHIGLSTNTTPMTRAQFYSNQVKGAMYDLIRAFKSHNIEG